MKLLLAALPAAVLVAFLARAQDASPPSHQGAAGEVILVPLDAGAPTFPADPPPLVTRRQWVIKLGYKSGQLSFRGAQRLDLPKPLPTPRSFGRFAVELYIGKELIDRVRFDFPLLGADDVGGEPPAGGERLREGPPAFAARLSTQVSVTVPLSERATRAVLVDRSSGTVWSLPWPLTLPGDAGSERG
jgi:hypothetical protein